MKIKNKVVLAGLLLSLSLTSCNSMSQNKNNADDSKNETEVTENADSKDKEEATDKDAEEKDNKDAEKADKADDKEASDKETAEGEEAEDKNAMEDKTDSEGAQTKEEAIAELEQAVFDSRVTVRAIEILQTEAPEAIEGREDEIQALIDKSNEVIERAREILDQVQNN